MSEPKNSTLILIDVQKGFQETNYWGKRNNPKMESNIKALLKEFRKKKKRVIHVRHHSTEPNSPLRPEKKGSDFMDFAKPRNELVITKTVNSAFIGTNLEEILKSQKIKKLILAGLTTDHCISTTARMAANLNFKVTIVEDATATFEKIGFDKKKYSADLIHAVSLASLKGEFAKIKSTKDIIKSIQK